MNTLLTVTNAFEKQLALYEGSSNNEKIIEASSYIYDALHKKLNKYKDAFTKYKVIKSLNDSEYSTDVIEDSLKDVISDSKEAIILFKNKWEAEKHQTQQSSELSESTKLITKISKELSEYCDFQWEKWIAHLEQQFQIEDVLLEQQKQIGNELVYDEYHSGLKKFDTLKSIEMSQSLITSLNQEKNNLIAIVEDMDFTELDEDVSKFLKQLNGRFNAQTPLSLVTPKVFEWLTENSMLSSLIVKRK
jgi:hypothetical protein